MLYILEAEYLNPLDTWQHVRRKRRPMHRLTIRLHIANDNPQNAHIYDEEKNAGGPETGDEGRVAEEFELVALLQPGDLESVSEMFRCKGLGYNQGLVKGKKTGNSLDELGEKEGGDRKM